MASAIALSAAKVSLVFGCRRTQPLTYPTSLRGSVKNPAIALGSELRISSFHLHLTTDHRPGYNPSPMNSPFPGMDPYLEASWRDVHATLIVYFKDHLQPQLSGDLRARVEERLVVESPLDKEPRNLPRPPRFRIQAEQAPAPR